MTAAGPRTGAEERETLVVRSTRLERLVTVPEVRLHLAGELTPLWELTEAELRQQGLPPPFWAFAWAGGLGIARWLLDHPDEVARRSVLDVASGSGLCGIAAALAGARSVTCADIDPYASAAARLNAAANGVVVGVEQWDPLASDPPDVDLVLAGDVSYEQAMAAAMTGWLRQAAGRGSRVLLGDPGRAYLDASGMHLLAEHEVATTPEVEDVATRVSRVYEVLPA